MSAIDLAIDDESETAISEITIQPDGRIYVFGTSRQILRVLLNLSPLDIQLNRLVARAHGDERCADTAAPEALDRPSDKDS